MLAPGGQVALQALVEVGTRRRDPAAMAGVSAAGILRGVIAIEFGGLLELAEAGGGVVATDGGHQQGAPIGGELLLLAEPRQITLPLGFAEAPEIGLLLPTAAQIGVAVEKMGELMGHHTAQGCWVVPLHQKEGSIKADQTLGVGAGAGGAEQVGQAVHLPLQGGGDVIRGGMGPGLAVLVGITTTSGWGAAQTQLASPVPRRRPCFQAEADRRGANPIRPQQGIGHSPQLRQLRWRLLPGASRQQDRRQGGEDAKPTRPVTGSRCPAPEAAPR